MQKHLRLTKKDDFSKVYRFGKSVANHQFVLYYLPKSDILQFRLGISVSKKVGNAVIRNRLRRVVKEIVRNYNTSIAPHYDFIVIARKPAVGMDYLALEKSILHLFRKAGLDPKKAQAYK